MAAESKRRESILSTNNRLFDLARTGELRLPKSLSESKVRAIDRTIYPAAVTVFGFSWPVLPIVLLIPVLIVLALVGRSSAEIIDSLLNFSPVWLIFAFVPVYLFVWLWLWLFEKRHLWTAGFEKELALIQIFTWTAYRIFVIWRHNSDLVNFRCC